MPTRAAERGPSRHEIYERQAQSAATAYCSDGDGTAATLTSIGRRTPPWLSTMSSMPCHTFANACPTSDGCLSVEKFRPLATHTVGSVSMPLAVKTDAR